VTLLHKDEPHSALVERKDSQGDLANPASASAETVRRYIYFPNGTTLRGKFRLEQLMSKSCGRNAASHEMP
jgi:hypothetical protein